MSTLKKKKAAKLGEMVEQLNDIVEQTFYLEQKVYEWNQIINKNKLDISKQMGKKGRLDIRVDEQTAFVVNKKVNFNIEFFPDQLKGKLSRENFNKVVDKTNVIDDVSGLVKMLKEYGVPPKEFKKFIKQIENPNNEKIDRLIDIGEVEIEDLQGCYKTEVDEEIRIKKQK